MLENLKIIALTHKQFELNQIGQLHLDELHQELVLGSIKINFDIDELMYLSTCNRVEFVLKTEQEIDADFLLRFFTFFNTSFEPEFVSQLVEKAQVFEGEEALKHLLHVASSIDSLVVGEREIITQVRKSYERCQSLGLTGDLLRLLVKQSIETAKEIYTHTNIAKNPVSVVSLAYRKLRELGVKNDARFLIIGAGETNQTMAKYLQKHQYANFAVFNRTFSKAESLAAELKGKAYELPELSRYSEGFDVIITCTGAASSIISPELYNSLLAGEKGRKIVIDLAIPNDLDCSILQAHEVNYISVNNLKDIAKENLIAREKELSKCEEIVHNKTEEFYQLLRERKVELAFSHIPKKVKQIKETALNEVFAKDLHALNPENKELLDKILNYMEKKYNAVAMKTAKEIFLPND